MTVPTPVWDVPGPGWRRGAADSKCCGSGSQVRLKASRNLKHRHADPGCKCALATTKRIIIYLLRLLAPNCDVSYRGPS